MEDEITKRELSDDELDNVSGGGCEENAARGLLVKNPQFVLMITDCGFFIKKIL